MTLRHMKILVAVFQQGSVTKAAQALHLAQPSVSLAIRELEEYYGVTLFDRIGRRLTPTAGGNARSPSTSLIVHSASFTAVETAAHTMSLPSSA